MRTTTDTIGRLWKLLRLLPREPRSITTVEINSRLAEQGYDADVRTIQRDLTTRETSFPLMCETEDGEDLRACAFNSPLLPPSATCSAREHERPR